jgi:hemerythrin-like domain-containing protein
MQATDILMDEHRVIEGVLAALETAAQRLEAGQAVRLGFFLDAADFIKYFADGCHHHKEEGVLFKAMVAGGMPNEGGPIGVMLSEHELGRAYSRAMRAAALQLDAGDQTARSAVVYDARAYTELLRQHIVKEDSVLFPLASRVIPADVQQQLMADFEQAEFAEPGVREKYLALAAQMAQEMGPA